MRLIMILLFLPCLGFSQSDSIVVQLNDGTRLSYPLHDIKNITLPNTFTSVEDSKKFMEVITRFKLRQNYPNPFNPSTTIPFTLPASGIVTVRIFDIQGKLVRELYDGFKPAGDNVLGWDGKDNAGSTVSTGTYLAQVRYNEQVLISKMVLIK